MTSSTLTTPSTAERVRSACARAAGAMLVADDVAPATTPVHHLLPGGSFAVSLPSAIWTVTIPRYSPGWPASCPLHCATAGSAR